MLTMRKACPWTTTVAVTGLSMDFPRVAVNGGPARVLVKQWLDSLLAFFMNAIFALFRTCRLVALKRKKDSQKPTAPPGSASGSRWPSITGVTGSPLQAAPIRSEALVKEYIQVKGLNAAYVEEKGKQRVLQEAVQFIQMVLLTDLRPPWLAHEFPQALPEGGVLSRFTRPQLLFWRAKHVSSLFGEELHRSFAYAAESVQLEFAGFVYVRRVSSGCYLKLDVFRSGTMQVEKRRFSERRRQRRLS